MDFNKIKTFLLVIESGSVSAAARKLHRTQSAISQQIQGLESDLGLSLFQSLRGSLLLTKEGDQIYQNVSGHFQAIENNVLSNQKKLEEISGTIRIGATPSIGHYYLPPLIAEFKHANRKVNVELVLQPDEEIELLLREDRIDVGFIINFKNTRLFNTKPFISFEESLICTSRYLSRFKKTKWQYADIKEIDLIDFDLDAPNISHWLKKNSSSYRSIISDPTSVIVVEDNECVKRLALQHIGAAMLPEYMISHELEAKKLIKLFPKSIPTKVTVDIATRTKKNFTHSLTAFLRSLNC